MECSSVPLGQVHEFRLEKPDLYLPQVQKYPLSGRFCTSPRYKNRLKAAPLLNFPFYSFRAKSVNLRRPYGVGTKRHLRASMPTVLRALPARSARRGRLSCRKIKSGLDRKGRQVWSQSLTRFACPPPKNTGTSSSALRRPDQIPASFLIIHDRKPGFLTASSSFCVG